MIECIEAVLVAHANPGARPIEPGTQRDRLGELAEECAERYAGDLCEIGALKGQSTVRFLQVAARHDRRVLVVDPWKPGTQNCRGHEYGEFIKNTQAYSEYLDIVRKASQHKAAIAAMLARELCWAYVDGLHKHGACLGDIMAVRHADLIVVDDVRVFDGVRAAFWQAAALLGRMAIYRPELGIREGYLV